MLVTQERQRCCAHEGNNRKDQAIVNLTRCKLEQDNEIKDCTSTSTLIKPLGIEPPSAQNALEAQSRRR